MKFGVSIFTGLLTYANDLFARAAFQGIEQALLFIGQPIWQTLKNRKGNRMALKDRVYFAFIFLLTFIGVLILLGYIAGIIT